MPLVGVVIMAIETLEANVSSEVKTKDGVRERRVIRQFGCQTARNAVSEINY